MITQISTYSKALLYLFVLILFSHQNLLTAQKVDWNLIDLSSSIALSGKINGLNMGGYSYGLINMQSPDTAILDECVQCMDFDCTILVNQENVVGPAFSSMQTKPAVVAAASKLKPGLLRFPGGTHSGWYHRYQYDDDGFYDAAFPQIDKGYGMNLGESIYLPYAYVYCKQDSRLIVSQNYIDGFINFIKNIQQENTTKIEITYVANLLTHFNFDPVPIFCLRTCGRPAALTPMRDFDCTQKFQYSYLDNEARFDSMPDVYRFELYYKETQDAIEYLITSLDLQPEDVIHVEMGNEYYNNEGDRSGYPFNKYGMSVNEYADLVEIYSERLKCYFAGKAMIKTGFVSKPRSNWQETDSTSSSHNAPGLINLLDQDYTNNGSTLGDVVDAVILHDYYTQSTCLDLDDISDRFHCAQEAFREYLEGDNGLISNLDDFRLNFPEQEIWLTEWNIVDGDGQKNISYINTILHAAFVQEYALRLLEYNAANQNIIKMAAHHRIGEDQPWSVVQVEDGNNEAAYVRASAYPMQYLNKLYEYDNFAFIGNVLKKDSASLFDTKEAKTTVFYQAADSPISNDRLLIYYSNKTDSTITDTIPSMINGKDVISANISYVYGDHLFSYGPSNGTHGRNQFKNNDRTYYDHELDSLGYGDLHDQLSSEQELQVEISQVASLPSHSVGILEIQLDTKVAVNEGPDSKLELRIHPNPTKELINLELKIDKTQDVSIELVDGAGRLIRQEQYHLSDGSNQKQLNISYLNAGLYFLVVKTNDNILVRKVLRF